MRALKKIHPVIWLTIVVLLIGGLVTVGYFFMKNKKESEQEILALKAEQEMELNKLHRSGYIALTDIQTGDLITEYNVIYSTTIISDLDSSLMISDSDFGKVAIVDIPVGAPVLLNDVSEDMIRDTTERECNFIYLNGNAQNNDFVDVRIMFPNGEDMVVVSKTVLKNPVPVMNSCYLWLSETENDMLSSAIIDANLNNARIYMNTYVNPAVEEASLVTYQPTLECIKLMETNPDVLAEAEASLSAAARNVLNQNLVEFFYNIEAQDELDGKVPSGYPHDFTPSTEIIEGAGNAVAGDGSGSVAGDMMDENGSSDSSAGSSESSGWN